MGNASPSVNGKTQYTNKYSIIYTYTLTGLRHTTIRAPHGKSAVWSVTYNTNIFISSYLSNSLSKVIQTKNQLILQTFLWENTPGLLQNNQNGFRAQSLTFLGTCFPEWSCHNTKLTNNLHLMLKFTVCVRRSTAMVFSNFSFTDYDLLRVCSTECGSYVFFPVMCKM
jgi:hypothetical protein